MDADGALWIADGLNGRVIRVRRGGEITEEIQPGTGVFACMLGGADGCTLFICTAPDFQEEARKNAREASLVTARVAHPVLVCPDLSTESGSGRRLTENPGVGRLDL